MHSPASILITGASSGIGESLALEYARSGICLALCGRDQERLDAVAERCRERGAEVTTKVLDVSNQAAMNDWIQGVDAKAPLDLVIANAGISGGSGNAGETEAQARAIFDVNLGGVLNTLWPAINAMKPRKSGHIALVSSLAAFTPLPGAPAYAASKAAVKAYGEALNGALKDDNITVTTICPGFVKSRITDRNRFSMPLLLTGADAAKIIRNGLDQGRSTHRISLIFPWPMGLASWLIGNLPPCVRRWVLLKAPKKEAH